MQNDQQAEHHGRKRPQALHLLLNAMSVGQESQRVATEQQRQHPDDAGERKQRRRHGAILGKRNRRGKDAPCANPTERPF